MCGCARSQQKPVRVDGLVHQRAVLDRLRFLDDFGGIAGNDERRDILVEVLADVGNRLNAGRSIEKVEVRNDQGRPLLDMVDQDLGLGG